MKYFLITILALALGVAIFFWGRRSVDIPPQKVTNDSLLNVNANLERLNTTLLSENEGSRNYIEKLENENRKMAKKIASYSIDDIYFYFRKLCTENQIDSNSVEIDYH